jgi:hypothetical protein
MSEEESRLGQIGIMRKEMFLRDAEPRLNLAALSGIIADLEVRFWQRHLSPRRMIYLDHTSTISIEIESKLLILQIRMHLIGTHPYCTPTTYSTAHASAYASEISKALGAPLLPSYRMLQIYSQIWNLCKTCMTRSKLGKEMVQR